MRTLLAIVVYAAAVWLAVALVGGLSFDGSLLALAVIGLVLATVNTFIKPLVKLLSLPLIVLTLGLFLLVINAAMLWITVRISEALDLGLTSRGFGSTLLGAVVIAIVAWAGEGLYRRD